MGESPQALPINASHDHRGCSPFFACALACAFHIGLSLRMAPRYLISLNGYNKTRKIHRNEVIFVLYKLLFIKIEKMCVYPQCLPSLIAVHTKIFVRRLNLVPFNDNFMRNSFGERYFTHTPFSFRRVTNKSRQTVVPQEAEVRHFYHMIRPSSCNKTFVINFLFFTYLFSWTNYNLIAYHNCESHYLRGHSPNKT